MHPNYEVMFYKVEGHMEDLLLFDKATDRQSVDEERRKRNEEVFSNLDRRTDFQYRKRDDSICIIHLCLSNDRKRELCIISYFACLYANYFVKSHWRGTCGPI